MSSSQSNCIFPGNTYKFFEKNQSMVMAVQDASKQNGAPVVQWPDTGGPDQLWTLEKVEGDETFFNILNVNSKKYVAVQDSSIEQGVILVQWDFIAGSEDQLWRLFDIGGGVMQIINKKSNFVISVQDNSPKEGVPLVQWPYKGGEDQKWTLVLTSENGA